MVSSSRIIFRKCKCFPIRFPSKRNRILTFFRCYINNFTGKYVFVHQYYNITVGKGEEASFNSLSLNLPLSYILSSSLSLLITISQNRSFSMTTGLTAHLNFPIIINSNIIAEWINLCSFLKCSID